MATVIDFPSPVRDLEGIFLSDPEQVPAQAAFVVGYCLREYERLRSFGDSEMLRKMVDLVRVSADLVPTPLFGPLHDLFLAAMNGEGRDG